MTEANHGTSVEREFVITRVFDAPRDLAFKAWTDAERLKHWWAKFP